MCLTETWLDESTPNSVFHCCDRYEIFRKDRTSHGGGVAIFVRRDLKSRQIHSDVFDELEMVSVLVKCNSQNVIFSCFYRPNVQNVEILKPLETALIFLNSPKAPLILAGDFNLPAVVWSIPWAPSLYQQDKFLDMFLSLGLYQMVLAKTRLHNTLDLFFSNEPFLISDVLVQPSISDHDVVTCNINVCDANVSTNCETAKYNWAKANSAAIFTALENINWVLIFGNYSPSVDSMWVKFVDICHHIISCFVPTKATYSTNKKRSFYPNSVKNLIRKKHKLYSVRNSSIAALEKFKQFSKLCKLKVREFHLEKESEVLRQPNVKKFYDFVNSRLNSRPHLTTLIKNDIVYEESMDCARILNEQYASVFVTDDGNPYDMQQRSDSVISDLLITRIHVTDSIKCLKRRGAMGIDDIPAAFYKDFAIPLSIPLQMIFQKSLNCGKIPNDWKKALVVPVFKHKGKRTDPSSYRPISLTCIASKIMERIIRNVVYDHLDLNNLITRHQHGFVNRKSTETQLLECVNDWTKSVDERKGVDVVYLDVSKAFDSVSHVKLLTKMERYGIKDKILLWVKDFLKDRTQQVRLNGILSDPTGVISGVPQGSVLGPLLFILFMNDIVDVCKDSVIKIFADDSKLYMNSGSIFEHQALLNDLKRVFHWMKVNQLSVAEQKCMVLHIGHSNPNFEYFVNGVKIPCVNKVKDLGVTICADLKFSHHCNEIATKAFQKSNLFFRAFLCRDPNFLRAVYITYIRSGLEYCSSVWNPYLAKDIKLVESVQRRFTKRMPGMRSLSYRERLGILDLSTLEIRRLYSDLCHCYKIVNNIENLQFNDFFESHTNHYSHRGHSKILKLPKRSLNCRHNFFNVKIIGPWNSLPENVISAQSLSLFKKYVHGCDLDNFTTLDLT